MTFIRYLLRVYLSKMLYQQINDFIKCPFISFFDFYGLRDYSKTSVYQEPQEGNISESRVFKNTQQSMLFHDRRRSSFGTSILHSALLYSDAFTDCLQALSFTDRTRASRSLSANAF